MNERLNIDGAKRILVPKGDDNVACIAAFQEETGLEVPRFRDRKLSARSADRSYWLVKGRDIPGLVDQGFAEIGVTGYDSFIEYKYRDLACKRDLVYQKIGEPMCRLALLAPKNKAENVAWRMRCPSNSRFPLSVATAFPTTIEMLSAVRDLPFRIMDTEVSGSVEIMCDLLGCDLVADIVRTGDTAAINGMTELESLMDIAPTLVQRSQP